MRLRGGCRGRIPPWLLPPILAGGSGVSPAPGPRGSSSRLGVLVLDANVGHGNLAVDRAKTVLFGDQFLGVGIVFLWAERDEVAIEIPLEFIVENDAQRPAARAFDPAGLLLIEAVQIGVVFGLSRLHQTVINVLVFGEPVASF